MAAKSFDVEGKFDKNGNFIVPESHAARLRELLGHDPAPGDRLRLSVVPADPVEHWLRTEVAASVDYTDAHPGSTISQDALRAEFGLSDR